MLDEGYFSKNILPMQNPWSFNCLLKAENAMLSSVVQTNREPPTTRKDMATGFKFLTVIGLGLIGGSFAMAVRAVFPDIHILGVDEDEEALTYAIRAGIVDKVSRQLPERFEENHLVVIATHLNSSLKVLSAVAKTLTDLTVENVLVMDVGSCKRQICELAETVLPEKFIGGHPMAGKEFSGIEQATSLLMMGKWFLLTPLKNTPHDALVRLEAFLTSLGTLPKIVDGEHHDRYMAYVSHLPQLYAIGLTNLLFQHEPARLLSYHGGGIDDQLRLSASPYVMWRDVYAQNQDNVKAALDGLIRELQLLSENLSGEALETAFLQANMVHRVFHDLKSEQVKASR
jgi:prephenate dehydrogenase